jgi:hypothetical protein
MLELAAAMATDRYIIVDDVHRHTINSLHDICLQSFRTLSGLFPPVENKFKITCQSWFTEFKVGATNLPKLVN